jgi:endonuclease/exonuclease/phosphatase family metal-dependent hydrolase
MTQQGEKAIERPEKKQDWERLRKISGKGLKILGITYLFFLICLILLLKFVGERNWVLSLILYAPPQIWLLPYLIFIPLSCWIRPKLCFLNLAGVFLILVFWMDWRFSLPRSPQTKGLTLLTNNIGQRKVRTLESFFNKTEPDIFLFQEAWRQEPVISRAHPGYFVSSQGQFILASKYEIKNSGLVSAAWTSMGPSAAWFEIDYKGRSVVIFNVHLPTPRHDFNRLRSGGILTRKGREDYAKSMEQRVETARELAQFFAKETRPCLIAGDFNMPASGYVHGLFAEKFTDVFASKGSGAGATFPGTTRNPISLFGPWLRIDYIFADDNWKPATCNVEPRQPAQHLAVSATLDFSAAGAQ